jgi:hypothetical protein
MTEYLRLSFILMAITLILYLGFNTYKCAVNAVNNANNSFIYSLTIK